MWVGRILLETIHQESASSFVTLTYNDKFVPHNADGVQDLVPKDLMDFINRLRFLMKRNIRYFAVGEYGDIGQRPHYHLALFGLDPISADAACRKSWAPHGESMGFVHVGQIEAQSANYIAGYTMKKMTGKDDDRLYGRHPEFTRMSRFPPIGALGVYDILSRNFMTKAGQAAVKALGDVPSGFRVYGKVYPFGRYWRAWLRQELGIEDPPEYIQTEALDIEDWKDGQEKAWHQNEKAKRKNNIRSSRDVSNIVSAQPAGRPAGRGESRSIGNAPVKVDTGRRSDVETNQGAARLEYSSALKKAAEIIRRRQQPGPGKDAMPAKSAAQSGTAGERESE